MVVYKFFHVAPMKLVEGYIYIYIYRNATLFLWKAHGVLFRVIDGDNEPSSFQEMLMNSTKQCWNSLTIIKKRIPIMITSLSPYINVSYFLRFRHYQLTLMSVTFCVSSVSKRKNCAIGRASGS